MRIFKENFIIGYAGQYMMVNLISFRRKFITKEEYYLLDSINKKGDQQLLDAEISFLKKLYDEKQILSEELIAWYDKQRELTFPKVCYAIGLITLNLTYDCNFQCNYCYQKDFKYKGRRLNCSDIDLIAKYVSEYNAIHGEKAEVEEVVISGGESLLPQNIDTINHILDVFAGKKFKLFTNGVNLVEYSNKIDYSKFEEIQVSLDGTNEIIKKVNKNNSEPFDKVLEGILLLHRKGIKVSIISMVTKETVEHLPQFLVALENSKLLDLENVTLRFSFVVNHGEEYTIDSSFYEVDEYLSLRKKVLELVGNRPNMSVDRLYDLTMLARVIYRKPNERIEGRMSMCKVSKGIPLTFGPDHGVFWCSCTNRDRKLANFDETPEILDKNPVFQDLANRNIYTVEKCKKCIYRFVCSAGCPLYSLHRLGCGNSYHCGIFSHPKFEEHAEWFLSM